MALQQQIYDCNARRYHRQVSFLPYKVYPCVLTRSYSTASRSNYNVIRRRHSSYVSPSGREVFAKIPARLAAVVDRAKVLTKSGASVDAINVSSEIPVHVSVYKGHQKTADVLLRVGASARFANRNGETTLYLSEDNIFPSLLSAGASVIAINKDQDTPLHLAAYNGHTDSVRNLIRAGANVNAINRFRNTPLHLSSKMGHAETVKSLLDARASVNAKGKGNMTPLHLSACEGHHDVMKILLDEGSSVSAVDIFENTPLHHSVCSGNNETVKCLLRAGACVNAKGYEKMTPLHLAVAIDDIGIVKTLLKNGARVNSKAYEEKTPLHLAANMDHIEIAEFLLESGSSLYAEDSYGRTVLELDDVTEDIIKVLKKLDIVERKDLTFNGNTTSSRAAKISPVKNQGIHSTAKTGASSGSSASLSPKVSQQMLRKSRDNKIMHTLHNETMLSLNGGDNTVNYFKNCHVNTRMQGQAIGDRSTIKIVRSSLASTDETDDSYGETSSE